MAIKVIFDNTPEGSVEYIYTEKNDFLTPEMQTSFGRLIALNRDAIWSVLKMK